MIYLGRMEWNGYFFKKIVIMIKASFIWGGGKRHGQNLKMPLVEINLKNYFVNRKHELCVDFYEKLNQ